MALTYTYSNGAISHYALKRAWGDCEKDGTNIGVFCQKCEHYLGRRGNYVLCEWHKTDDNPKITGPIRREIYEELRGEALRYLDC